MKYLFLSITIAFYSANLQAQDTLRNSIQVSVGLGHLAIQDLTFSPFIHKSFSPISIGFNYQRSKKLEQIASLDYSGYKARIGDEFTYTSFRDSTKSYQTYPHNFTRIQLNYSLGKTVFRSEKLALAVGGRSNNRLYLSNYTFGNNGSFGYYFNLGLDIWFRGSYNITGNQTIEANLFLPLFSFNTRSPYLSQDDEYFQDIYSHKGFKSFLSYFSGGEIQSWNKNRYFDLDISYLVNIKAKWRIGASYGFFLGFNKTPARYACIENKLRFIAAFRF